MLAVSSAKLTDQSALKNVFLSQMGTEALRVYKIIRRPHGDETFQHVVDMLNAHFIKRFSEYAERVRLLLQENWRHDGESSKHLLLRLREMAQHCNFGATFEPDMLQAFIVGCRMPKLTRKVISDGASHVHTLTNVIDMAKGFKRKEADASAQEGQPFPARSGDIHNFA